MSYLIVGLGNPGKTYEKTRHNIGFRAVEKLAERFGIALKKKILLRARLGRGSSRGKEIYLLEPLTYMNLSGPLISKVMKKHGIALERVLVLVDDIAISFGQIRLRGEGSSGGHNGLKSIQDSLATKSYARLRIGIGGGRNGDLAGYVLAPFVQEEEREVPKLLEQVANVAEMWLTDGLTSAMNRTNQTNS